MKTLILHLIAYMAKPDENRKDMPAVVMALSGGRIECLTEDGRAFIKRGSGWVEMPVPVENH